MPDTSATRQNSAIVTLDNVCFAYEQEGDDVRQVLRNVSFSLLPGQHVGLYGPNGSGKTTLFRCITGLLRPQKGRIIFHGTLLEKDQDFHKLRCQIGFLLQNAEDQLFFPTVLEDVAFGPLNLGLKEKAARERAMETLHDLGLSGFENRYIHRLSGGEKKLVSLAAVLAMRPEALLLDEPTNDLDKDARQRFIDILESQDIARITISHDWDFLTRISTTYLTINQGQLTDKAPSFPHTHIHAHPLGNAPHAH